MDVIGSQAHRQMAREGARESLILPGNDKPRLPFAKMLKRSQGSAGLLQALNCQASSGPLREDYITGSARSDGRPATGNP